MTKKANLGREGSERGWKGENAEHTGGEPWTPWEGEKNDVAPPSREGYSLPAHSDYKNGNYRANKRPHVDGVGWRRK